MILKNKILVFDEHKRNYFRQQALMFEIQAGKGNTFQTYSHL